MSPLSGITSIQAGAMPGADLMRSEAAALRAPSELGNPPGITPGMAPAQPAGGDSFATMLGNMVSEVNAQQNTATQTVNALQSGQNVPLHQAVIAMEEANVSFQLMVEVRNRLLDGYQEIMRMQI
jgi:flagellar hook-basal body complex protein FliE